ncbi:MAG TPA: hypothetical protein VD763_03550, partial [Candidatus Saccharimonadales bacterium]|nr:hypothetical protein [Candidatus Saccharimonadales bacterium]
LMIAAAADRGALLGPGFGSCPECTSLHGDLRAIVAAIALATTPRRPRDYRLTEDDARRLRSTGIRGWLRAFATPADTISRPIATTLAALGLVGLLVGTVPATIGDLAPGAGAAPGDSTHSTAGGSAGPTVESLQLEAPSAPIHGLGGPGPADGDGSAPRAVGPGGPVTDPTPLLVLSGSMVVAGLGLFGLRRSVRRRRAMR